MSVIFNLFGAADLKLYTTRAAAVECKVVATNNASSAVVQVAICNFRKTDVRVVFEGLGQHQRLLKHQN